MRDLLSWNISLGRWFGVQVRLHVFFIVFAVFLLNFMAQEQALAHGALVLGVMLASILVHEFAHCSAAWYVNGTADQILVWPMGGLASVHVAHEPKSEFLSAIAGPLVNLLICLAALPGLLALDINVWTLCHPLRPPSPAGGVTFADALQFAFWVNWILFLANMAPAFPLDGARMWRSILWPRFGYRSAVTYVAMLARLTAVGQWVVAWLVRNGEVGFASLPLTILGIVLFFTARQEADRLGELESDESSFPYDFSQGYTSLDRSTAVARKRGPGPLRQWIETRRAERVIRQRQLEEHEERRADEILARLHETGMDGLSADDRALLGRVSARYRSRQRH